MGNATRNRAHIMIIVTLGISNAKYNLIAYQNDKAKVLAHGSERAIQKVRSENLRMNREKDYVKLARLYHETA